MKEGRHKSHLSKPSTSLWRTQSRTREISFQDLESSAKGNQVKLFNPTSLLCDSGKATKPWPQSSRSQQRRQADTNSECAPCNKTPHLYFIGQDIIEGYSFCFVIFVIAFYCPSSPSSHWLSSSLDNSISQPGKLPLPITLPAEHLLSSGLGTQTLS